MKQNQWCAFAHNLIGDVNTGKWHFLGHRRTGVKGQLHCHNRT